MKHLKLFGLCMALFACLFMVGCGTSSTGSTGSTGAATNATANEDYFEWYENTIIGFTNSGLKQETLVIPERCEGFDRTIFAYYEANAKYITFESDKDIDLNGAFYAYETLVSITLPAELTELGNNSFYKCSSLESIVVPAGVTVINNYTFQKASSLTSIVFEGNVTEIGNYAFEECTALETMKLPDSITTIGDYAFVDCDSYSTVTLPTSLTTVGDYTFSGANWQEITVPAEVEFTDFKSSSFVQVDHDVTINLVEGSWFDIYFDEIVSGGFVKNYIG